MKILLVGSNQPMAIERYYANYLRMLGADVLHYAAADIVADFHNANILNKILFSTGIYKSYAPVNRELIRVAAEYEPNIIFVFKGMEIYPSTLDILRKKFLLANYNPDHPFIFSGKGSGNANVTNSVGLYHLHFCYNQQLKREIETKCGIPAVFLPFGFDLADQDYLNEINDPEIIKVCFLGNPDEKRKEVILQLAGSGIPVDVYGHHWDKTGIAAQNGVSVFDAVYGTGFWKWIRCYRVQLNVFRPHNKGSHNMRTFEIPAGGGIELAPFSEEQAAFFEGGREIFFYSNKDELINTANKILALSENQARVIRNAARLRSVKSGYRYEDRARTVYNTFKTMMAW